MKNTIIIILLNILAISCGVYSFSGASIPNDAKSFYIENIKTKITSPTYLQQTIKDNLESYILEQTNLNLKNASADLIFIGEIIKYELKPMAITANETASKNRLTITVKFTYKNIFNEKDNFENTFKRYKDFESSNNFIDIEESLIDEITNELVEDIFNKAFVNW